MTALFKIDITVCLFLIASSFRVTEENSSFQTDMAGTPSFFRMVSLLLKELNLYFVKKRNSIRLS